MIQEQVRDGGTALPWADRILYTRLMLERSVQAYRQHARGLHPTFFDRGIPDHSRVRSLIGLKDDQFIRRACDQLRHASASFFSHQRGVRSTRPTANANRISTKRSENLCFDCRTYQQCGYEVVEIREQHRKQERIPL